MYTIYHHPPTNNYIVCGPSYRSNFCENLMDAINYCNCKPMYDSLKKYLTHHNYIIVATTSTLDNIHINHPELFV